MQKVTRPAGATHIENDGTFWKNDGGTWFFWCVWIWSPYIGKVNQNFLRKLRAIG